MPSLSLDSGRVVAYEQDGDPQSNRVLLFFAEIFAIGSIQYTFPVVKEQGLHHAAVTYPDGGMHLPSHLHLHSLEPLPAISPLSSITCTPIQVTSKYT